MREQVNRVRTIAGVIPAGSGSGFGYTTSRVALGDYRVKINPTHRILAATVTPQTGALGYAATCIPDSTDPFTLVVKVFTAVNGAAAEANCNFDILVVET